MVEFMGFPTQREHVLTYGNTTIGVIPELCLVTHFQVGDWPVLYRPAVTKNVKRWGIPLMIPNFGSLPNDLFVDKGTNLPGHGFGRELPWTTIAHDDHSITLQLSNSDKTYAQYPYQFTFTATIAVGEQTLVYTLVMENHSNEVMPIAPGFHPYFSVAQEDKPEIVTDGPVGFSVHDFQWDTNPPNHPYPFPHEIHVEVPHYGRLTIAEQTSLQKYSLATMQVWSEPATAPDHNFVCFEPVVASAGGLNRPSERLNIAAHSSHQIILQCIAHPF